MDASRKNAILATIKRIHAGEDVESLKVEFGKAVKDLSEVEIAAVEEEAMREGATVDDVRKLCGAHLEVFKASMAEKPLDLPHWHPLHVQEEEHIDMANKVSLLKSQVHALLHGATGEARTTAIDKLRGLAAYFGRAESNFLKQENVFFPILERHGIAQPPKIMWAEHDLLRAVQKRLAGLAAALSPEAIPEAMGAIRDTVLEYEGILLEHIMKERTILFPASLQLFTTSEWMAARREFDDIGYFAFYPMPLDGSDLAPDKGEKAAESGTPSRSAYEAGSIDLDTGLLSRDELLAIMKKLPIDISFVDAEDRVKFFNDTPERIFVRTKAVIGRSVQNCHPPKSLHVVQAILDDFRTGKKENEDFWIKLGDKYVLIRYFAVRDAAGRYLGALETSQDIAPMRALEGEKRILP